MKRLIGLARGARGFTLAEALMAVGITTVALSMVGSSVYQSLSVDRKWRDDVLATKDWRSGEGWVAGDALNTVTTSLVDGAQPVSSVTLGWSDTNDVPHSVVYSLSGQTLVRTYDGVSMAAARRVVSVGFSLSVRILTVDLVVSSDHGQTESSSLQTYLRMLQ